MGRSASTIYGVSAAACAAVFFALGREDLLLLTVGPSAVIAVLAGIELHRPSPRGPWRLFAMGLAVYVAAGVAVHLYAARFGRALPFPGVDDLFRLAAYVCIGFGLLQLVRRRSPGRDWPAFIDSLIVALGVGTLSWVFLMSPYFSDTKAGPWGNFTSLAYPAMDLVLLSIAVALRLADGSRRSPRALSLILAAVGVLLVWDTLSAWDRLYAPSAFDAAESGVGWLVFCALWGAAALHGSMRDLSERAEAPSEQLTWWRLAILGTAALLPPALQALQIATHDVHDTEAIVGATFVLFALVVARVAGLAKTQQRSVSRELTLREAAASLSTATSRSGIHEAAMDAVRTLVGSDAEIRICQQVADSDRGVVVAARGGPLDVTGTHVTFAVPGPEPEVRVGPAGSVVVAPLSRRPAHNELLVVASHRELERQTLGSLSALAAQVALALESATLTEGLLLQQSEARFAALVRYSTDLVTVIDAETRVRYASPSTSRVLGYEPVQLEGSLLTSLVHPEDVLRVLSSIAAVGSGRSHGELVEFRLRHRDGRYLHVESLPTDLSREQGMEGIVLNTRDITDRRMFEEELTRRAFLDTVTGLPNRALFRDRVRHALARAAREGAPVAVLFLDLDDFKTVNDSLGHAAGDDLLRSVGERLTGVLREGDTAARFGGDEFAVLLEEGAEPEPALEVAERIREVLAAPMVVEGTEVFLRASIGVAVAQGGGGAVDALLRDADVAMYIAKENGKGQCRLFEPSMQESAFRRLALKGDLQRAVEREEFVLCYQPIVELATGRIAGAEALIRWDHPQQGLLPPLEFIPLAEETGLIVPIGRWGLTEACRQVAEIQRRFPQSPPLRVAVNLSARQLQRVEITREVREALHASGLEAESLTLEITESVMMGDMELSVARLRSLKELGVLLAIDDFGTGYSSLNYLRRFPVDILKIDKSFIDGLIDGGDAAALTAAVVELARVLGLRTVAEGVRRADQVERLLELGCDLAQGELFAMPLAPDELITMLRDRTTMWADADALLADGVLRLPGSEP